MLKKNSTSKKKNVSLPKKTKYSKEFHSNEISTTAKRSNVLEIGYPFFTEESQRAIYSKALHRQLEKERLFKGKKEIQWEPAKDAKPAALYAPETNLGIVAITNLGAAAYYGRQGLLQPLENIFPNYQYTFLDMGWRKGVIGNNLFSVPQHVSIRLLFYRKDLLKKYFFNPPQTWDDLEDQALTILKGENSENILGLLMNFNAPIRFSIFLDYLWSQGADLYENGPDWVLNRKALEAALRQMDRFFKNGMIPPYVLTWDYSNPYKAFLDGHCVFLHHWSDGIEMINQLPEAEREKFGWCPVPSMSFKVPGKSMVGGLNYVIPKNTRYPEAAAKTLSKIMDEPFQNWYASNLGTPFPGMKSVYLEKLIRQKRPYLDQAEFFLRHGKIMEECGYFQGDYLDWLAIGGQELTFFLEGKASVAETIRRMEERFTPLLPQQLYSGLTAKAIGYIQAHMERTIKVEEIAKHLNVTPEHFIRIFKQNTRQTPLQYINEAKMERAKVLLKKSSMSIGEIAYQVGYKNRDHFSRLFHKLVKRSPSDFRN